MNRSLGMESRLGYPGWGRGSLANGEGQINRHEPSFLGW